MSQPGLPHGVHPPKAQNLACFLAELLKLLGPNLQDLLNRGCGVRPSLSITCRCGEGAPVFDRLKTISPSRTEIQT